MIVAGRAGETTEQAMERLAARFLKGAQKSTVLPPPAGHEYVNVCAALCGADARSSKLQCCAACIWHRGASGGTTAAARTSACVQAWQRAPAQIERLLLSARASVMVPTNSEERGSEVALRKAGFHHLTWRRHVTAAATSRVGVLRAVTTARSLRSYNTVNNAGGRRCCQPRQGPGDGGRPAGARSRSRKTTMWGRRAF